MYMRSFVGMRPMAGISAVADLAIDLPTLGLCTSVVRASARASLSVLVDESSFLTSSGKSKIPCFAS